MCDIDNEKKHRLRLESPKKEEENIPEELKEIYDMAGQYHKKRALQKLLKKIDSQEKE